MPRIIRYACQRCGQTATVGHLIYRQFTVRLELPYLSCSHCGRTGYSRREIRRAVSAIRRDSPLAKAQPFGELYRWATQEMERHMAYCQSPSMGWHPGRFRQAQGQSPSPSG